MTSLTKCDDSQKKQFLHLHRSIGIPSSNQSGANGKHKTSETSAASNNIQWLWVPSFLFELRQTWTGLVDMSRHLFPMCGMSEFGCVNTDVRKNADEHTMREMMKWGLFECVCGFMEFNWAEGMTNSIIAPYVE